VIYDLVSSQPQTCIVACPKGTYFKMEINNKIAFTSAMVISKVHLLVSISGLTCLPKHPFHNFTQHYEWKGTHNRHTNHYIAKTWKTSKDQSKLHHNTHF